MIDHIDGMMTIYIITEKTTGEFMGVEQFQSRAKDWQHSGDFKIQEDVFDIHADDYGDDVTEEEEL